MNRTAVLMTGEMLPLPSLGVSVIILAGGQSSRLRTPSVHCSSKAFLPVDGQPLIVGVVHKLATLSDDLIVVTNDPAPYGPLALPVQLVPDEEPGQGALMGIYSGLKAARHRHALVVACDMPFLNMPLLRYMLSLVDSSDIVIPQVGGLLEPLHAIYSKTCLPAMIRLLNQGGRQIIAFFHEVRVRRVDEQEIDGFDPLHLSFVNVNTPVDWEKAQELLTKQHQGQASAGNDQAPNVTKS